MSLHITVTENNYTEAQSLLLARTPSSRAIYVNEKGDSTHYLKVGETSAS